MSDEADELLTIASAWVDRLSPPLNVAEDLALRSILQDVATRWSAVAHDRAHRGRPRRHCGFVTTYALDVFSARGGRPATESFREWAQTFAAELARTHPESPARRATALIAQRNGGGCDVSTLAKILGVSASRLQQAFRQEYGIPVAEYVRHVRLLHALDILSTTGSKIEPLALEAGYRSKKNFYRVFKDLTGITPFGFRQLSPETARRIVEETRLSLLRQAKPTNGS